MLSQMMGLQGPSLLRNPAKGTSTNSQRGFRMLSSTVPIAPGKVFGNPNYVNRFAKCRNKKKSESVVSLAHQFKKCPEDIPNMTNDEKAENLPNQPPDISFTAKRPTLILEDFIISRPVPDVHVVLKRIDHIEIPTLKGKEMLVTITKSSPPNRTCQYSYSDSEDPFVIFNHKDNEELTGESKDYNAESKRTPCRQRLPSLCESEDSFIMFESDDEERLDDDDISFEGSWEDNEEQNNSEEAGDSDDEIDSSYSSMTQKKVKFASDDKLCVIRPMIAWAHAYQAARIGPWERMARDRCRFKDRALRVERDIKHIFDPQHRNKIYTERFENS